MGSGWRPHMVRGVPKALVRVLEMCWHQDPTQRWSAGRAAQELQMIVDTFVEPTIWGGCVRGCTRKSSRVPRRGTQTVPVDELGNRL